MPSITFYLQDTTRDKELRLRLHKQAKLQSRSVSSFIRHALLTYLSGRGQ